MVNLDLKAFKGMKPAQK